VPQIKAVVSVIGQDQKGVVARFATYLAEHGVNIEDIEQQVVHGRFIMDMLVDLADMGLSLDQLITGLLDLGRSIEPAATRHETR
jgi:predicted amino acid-binding ACT domain protein